VRFAYKTVPSSGFPLVGGGEWRGYRISHDRNYNGSVIGSGYIEFVATEDAMKRRKIFWEGGKKRGNGGKRLKMS
jgi:hypothetical protein